MSPVELAPGKGSVASIEKRSLAPTWRLAWAKTVAWAKASQWPAAVQSMWAMAHAACWLKLWLATARSPTERGSGTPMAAGRRAGVRGVRREVYQDLRTSLVE